MESLKTLYKIGMGPSSSHTMGPRKIAEIVKARYPKADHFVADLYGSLALTGKGHLTDQAILAGLKMTPTSFQWHREALPLHPNGMKITAYQRGACLGSVTGYSIGGGDIVLGSEPFARKEVYREHNLAEIKAFMKARYLSFPEYVYYYEDIREYGGEVLDAMFACIESGLKKTGPLPGKLGLERVAGRLYQKEKGSRLRTMAYAYAASEENASGGVVVTAPTCGSCGILPAVLYTAREEYNFSKGQLIDALAVAGVFGNVVRHNATISGAEGGCQAEVGTATAMAAAAYAYLLGLKDELIEYAAEMGLEHQLGLTCDPVGGYVQIPCIERNGYGALRAIDAASFAKDLGAIRGNLVSFDAVVNVMKETGRDLRSEYRETALGGLAKEIRLDD